MKILLIGLALAFLAADAFAYYMPEQGRWMSRDPLGEAGDSNVYAIVDNDPVSFYDDLGQQKAPSQKPQLTLVAQPFGIPNTKFCGKVDFTIWWTFLNAVFNTKGGHVIQDITISWDIKDCKGKGLESKTLGPDWKDRKSVHYWEAWPVNANASFSSPKEDFFYWEDEGDGTKGSVSWKATASFYHALNSLPKDFVPFNEATLAGPYPSTIINPNLPNGTVPVPHEMTIEWNCCCPNGTPTRRLTEVKSHVPSKSK